MVKLSFTEHEIKENKLYLVTYEMDYTSGFKKEVNRVLMSGNGKDIKAEEK